MQTKTADIGLIAVAGGKNADLIARRYQLLNQLGAGGMGELYRALDRLTGRTVALKRIAKDLTPSSSDWGDRTMLRLALAQEFRTLASLRHPNVISVLDYGFDESSQPFFTMELQEDAQTILQAAQGQTLDVQVSLLLQLLQGLAYVHRRGIIHRDLKPANVLVRDGQVKVVDFGVSVRRDHRGDTTAGTLAYMAPELLRGEDADVPSDLYAVGVIAFELFAGRRPYLSDTPGKLAYAMLHDAPDFSVLKVPVPLVEALRRLLAQRAQDRYPGAEAAIAGLCHAAGLPQPQETPLIRESYLQAAKLVGRDGELSRLTEALHGLLSGHGSAWLIGGESGVGKSRILEELRAQALVQGPLVLRGQAVREGGVPYQLWRGTLRWLTMLMELTTLETGVLKPLVSDLAQLTGGEVPDAPHLDPEASQERLISVIEGILSRLDQPAVLMLEDLQWCGSNSLAVLRRVNRLVERLPILIVASYRDDERPTLPSELPGMALITLHRLEAGAIADLSEAMLGSAGRQPDVTELLTRETEGNPFFLVEVIRALAQEAGDLGRVGTRHLPLQVFTGGMQRVLQSRLARIPFAARNLLQRAAVLGREIDLGLLKVIDPATDMENWLDLCVNAAIVEGQAGNWRFSHDKLRDALLGEIPNGHRVAVHRQIAIAIESLYPAAKDKYPALVHHWARAGVTDKEAHYCALAGELALGIGAYKEAIGYLARALELRDQTSIGQLEQAHLERLLGEAFNGLGQLEEARAHLRTALDLLGAPVPGSKFGLTVGLLAQALRQVVHRLWPERFVGGSRQESTRLLEAARAYVPILEISHFANETMVSLYASLRTLNLSEAAGQKSPELARAYANMCYATGLVPLRSLAESYARLARDTALNLEEEPPYAWVLFVSGFYHSGQAQWELSRQEIELAQSIYDALGDRRRWGESLAVRSYSPYFRGEFAQGAASYVELYQASRHREDIQQQVWALDGQAMHVLRLGKTEQSLALLKVARPMFAQITDRFEEILHHGLWALTHLRRGENELAGQAAERAARLIAQSRPAAPYALEGYSAVAEVYLALLGASSKRGERRALARAARKAVKAVGGFAHVFPLGLPRYWLWAGMALWLAGRHAKAHKAWQKCLAHAGRLEMPYEEALAHYYIGQHLPFEDPSRRSHLLDASELFSHLNAAYEWAHARWALGAA
ncbi:MAG TPA: AAA family ATPase [Anaerolineales bacterium]|nr:AAA family ATPase [Anaerolineales bacterium]